MQFETELNELLPPDLPNREDVVRKSAAHLELIVQANAYMNLTRILSPREAAIKHVLDSVIPWQLFKDARIILDAGTGPGYPGIPLALVFPDKHFILADSTQKKARFVESVVTALDLTNVTVTAQRVEDLKDKPDLATARAFAPLDKALQFLAPVIKSGAKALLYKGPDAASEIATAAKALTRLKAKAEIITTYNLPDAAGARTIITVAPDLAPAKRIP